MAKEFSLMAPKDLSPLITDLKMSSPADTRDAGFCSGEDEDLDVDHVDTDADLNSPTDVSEDSVDVKVHVIGGIGHKRKHTVRLEDELRAKKPCTQIKEDPDLKSRSPFRPWNHESFSRPLPATISLKPPPIPCGYIPQNYRPTEQEEPLSLVIKNKVLNRDDRIYKPKYAGKLDAFRNFSPEPSIVPKLEPDSGSPIPPEPCSLTAEQVQIVPKLETVFCSPLLRPPEFTVIVPKTESIRNSSDIRDHSLNLSSQLGPAEYSGIVSKPESTLGSRGLVNDLSLNQSSQIGPPKLRIKMETRDEEHRISDAREELRRHLNPAYRELAVKQETEVNSRYESSSHQNDPYELEILRQSEPSTSSKSKKTCKSSQSQQRNYKNMTRERRMEANARERTRVHTISAAFETLRHTVPAYSHNQKLSKLSVLRIACSYIMTLSRLAGMDYSEDQSEPSVASCVETVSKTIQMEGKLRKKKDE